jgi:hypothetical protein
MHWTMLVFYAGLILFALGLVTAHVVLFASWSAGAKNPSAKRVLGAAMRVAVVLFVVGLALAATGYFASR